MKAERGDKTLRTSKMFCLILSLIFLSCNHRIKQENGSTITEKEDITQSAYDTADSILLNLSLECRIGQCLMPSIMTNDDSLTVRLLKKYIDEFHVGGIVLLTGTFEAAKHISEISELSSIPLFIAIDAEWGLGMRLDRGSVYPMNRSLGQDAEESFMFDYGEEIARECKSIGINMVLGPVVDVTGQRGGVIGKRSFGDNPQIVSDLGVAYSKGLEAGGVISVAKHFPGHGSALKDSHREIALTNRSISDLDTIDLKPFKNYINSGLTGIMAGHISSRALDPEGRAASVSTDILSNLLREEMGFKGLVFTDAFDMGGARGFSVAEALKAGADIILCPRNVDLEVEEIINEIKKGSLDVKIINDRCRRILFTKCLFHIIRTKKLNDIVSF